MLGRLLLVCRQGAANWVQSRLVERGNAVGGLAPNLFSPEIAPNRWVLRQEFRHKGRGSQPWSEAQRFSPTTIVPI